MKLYLIGGLGADERVFKFLNCDHPNQVIKWIEPLKMESIEDYTKRISEQINIEENFGILGVSFGGIIAVELSKIIKPQITILISSVELASQLPRNYLKIVNSGIFSLLPNSVLKPPKFIMHYLFGAKNKKLLNQIIDDTKPEFIKWALNTIVNWKNETRLPNIVRIHGTQDRLFPLVGEAIEIENGKHFMIVDNSKEISRFVNETLKNAC